MATSTDLDLAFSADPDLPLPLQQAGADYWQSLMSTWLQQLAPELPASLQAPAYSLGLSLVADAEIADIRGDIVEAAWGNQIRNYVFHPYQMVKDLRTQQETTDVQGVMDGDLDPFIQSLLHAGVDVAGGSSDD